MFFIYVHRAINKELSTTNVAELMYDFKNWRGCHIFDILI